MRTLRKSALSFVFLMGTHLAAEAATLPLYDAFRSFCADTDLDYDKVRSELEAAGARQIRPTADTTTPWVMTTTGWSKMIDGHQMMINLGTQTIPARGFEPVRHFESCSLVYLSGDAASIARLLAWPGVEPTRVSRETRSIHFFDFQKQSGKHLPLPKDKFGRDQAEKAGRVWQLVVISGPGQVSAQLMHMTHVEPATGKSRGKQ